MTAVGTHGTVRLRYALQAINAARSINGAEHVNADLLRPMAVRGRGADGQ